MTGARHRHTVGRRAALGLTAALLAAPQSNGAELHSPRATTTSPARAADDAGSTWWASAAAGQAGAVVPPPPTGTDEPAEPTPQAGGTGAVSALAASGIPATALEAYVRAAAGSPAACHISWSLIAGIGRVESDHGRFAGAVLHTDGRSTPPVIGIALDGTRSALIRDTDGGRLDGDPVYDRAVGPTQFIPSTWATYASDGDGNGSSDPFDIDDAAAATAKYLCAAGGDLSSVAGQRRAVLAYNHSDEYVATVLGVAASYAGTPPPVIPTPAVESLPTLPPANPAPPSAIVAPPPAAAPVAATEPTASTPSTATASASAAVPPATPAPTPTATPTPSPTSPPTPTSTPSPTPTAIPSPTPTPIPSPTPTPTTSPTPTPTPTPTPAEQATPTT